MADDISSKGITNSRYASLMILFSFRNNPEINPGWNDEKN